MRRRRSLAGALLGLALLSLLILLAAERTGGGAADAAGADAAAPEAALLDPAAAAPTTDPLQRIAPDRAAGMAAAGVAEAVPTSGIRVLDGVGRPLPSAGAHFGAPRPVLRADAAGWIAVGTAGAAETPCLVAAAGFRPRIVAWRSRSQEVALEPDSGLALRVLWAGTRQPVAGAQVRRRVPRGLVQPAGAYEPDWLEQALDALLPPVLEVDEAGSVFLPVVRLSGHGYFLFEVRAEGAPLRLLDLLAEAERDFAGDRLHPLTLELERAAAPAFRIVDAAGEPLVDRIVIVLVRGVPYITRSDAQGAVTPAHAPLAAHGGDAVEVELGDGRFWRAAGVPEGVLICRHRTLRGSVVPPQSGRWLVASAHGIPGAIGPTGPQPLPRSRLLWRPADEYGAFTLDEGWQGDRTCVLLRDAGSGLVVAQAEAQPGVALLLQAPRRCRLHLDLAPRAPSAGLRVQLVPHAGQGLEAAPEEPDACMVAVAQLPAELLLPFGRYRVDLLAHESRQWYADLNLQQDEVWMEIAPPAPRRVHGLVRGQISGPLRGARLRCLDEQGVELLAARSGGDGRYVIELLHDGDLQVQAFWPALRGQWWLDNEPASGARLRAGEIERELDFVLEEARILARKDPADALLARPDVYFYLLRWSAADERTGDRTIVEELSDGRHSEVELIVPPGRYAVSWDLRDSQRHRSPIVAVTGGETRELWLQARDSGRLEIRVCAPQGTRYFPEWRCDDASGAEQWSEQGWMLDFAIDPEIQGVPYFMLPGAYELSFGGTVHPAEAPVLSLPPVRTRVLVREGTTTSLEVEITGDGHLLVRSP